MFDYLKSDYVLEEKVEIIGIPSIIFKPRYAKGLLPTIIHYHGWSSNKERQRIRGYILATLGYQVVLPDSINHGERNPLDDYGPEGAIEYFWDTVFQNLDESHELIDVLLSKHKADINKIGIMGHSMGAITGIGVFAYDSRVKTLVAYNGTGAWRSFHNILKEALSSGQEIEGMEKLESKIEKLDPVNNLDLLKNRSMILLHGIEDDVVPIESQEYFYERARKEYDDKRNISFIKYKNTKHLISTNMLEDSLAWIKRHI